MLKLVRCPVCRRPDLCVIACPNNKFLDQFIQVECDVQSNPSTADDEALEIVFDTEEEAGNMPDGV